MTDQAPGPIFVIGGHEDKVGERVILGAVAEALHGRKLVLATVASRQPKGYFEAYEKAFADLGVTDLVELYLNDRAETHDDDKVSLFDDAGGVFFTGGDQLRISSQIGDTPIEHRIREVWAAGVTQSNIAEEREERPLSIYDVRLHVLTSGDAFDLAERRPHAQRQTAEERERQRLG